MNPRKPTPAETRWSRGVSAADPTLPNLFRTDIRVKVMRKATFKASAIEINTGVDAVGAYNNELGAFLGSWERSKRIYVGYEGILFEEVLTELRSNARKCAVYRCIIVTTRTATCDIQG